MTNPLLDDVPLYFGTSSDAVIEYDTAITPKSLFIGVGTDSRILHIGEKADKDFDWAIAQRTNPAIFLHSAAQSTTQWLLLEHDGTDAAIAAGSGGLRFIASGNYQGFIDSTGIIVSAARRLGFSSGAGPSSGIDAWFERPAAGVMTTGTNAASGVWLQQLSGELALAADYTNATAVMSATALNVTLKSGRTYSFNAELMFANSTAADGFLLDFNGGTATVTNFRVGCRASNAAGATLAFTNAVSVALDTDIDVTLALTTQASMTCNGTFVPSANGTFILRASEKVDGSGTLTIYRGSWLNIRDANPL